jgi:hypothetical protein
MSFSHRCALAALVFVASTGIGPTRPAEDTATGTAGTPKAQTGTDLAINRLEVSSVRRAGGDCER